MANLIVGVILAVLCAAGILCALFFIFEKPLRRISKRRSDKRFQRRTGIDPSQFPNPFE